MQYIRNLSEVSRRDVEFVGGKAASLGELIQAGFRIPPGFVVLSTAFDVFKKTKEMPQDVALEIRKAFDDLKAAQVAVRSSATDEDGLKHSWAGQLETYLYTTKRNVLQRVRKCWESIYSPRAMAYRAQNKRENKKVHVAVVIQKMIPSEISGVCFTIHPVTGERNKLVIETVHGVGEPLVGGKITPDTYIVQKKPLRIFEPPIQNRNILSKRQIMSLAKLCIEIERHFNTPQDIEWALYKKVVYIVQSRPVTTV